MIAGLLAVAALLAPAPAARRQAYDGPLGLKWGQSRASVLAALKSRFSLEGETASGAVLHGEFAGLATERITAIFDGDKLAGVVVEMPRRDTRPKAKVWSDLVALITRSYGEPDEIAAPRDPATDPMLLDMDIKDGAWSPHAVWNFPHGVSIRAVVDVDEPDARGVRQLSVLWMFSDDSAALKAFDALPRPPRDF